MITNDTLQDSYNAACLAQLAARDAERVAERQLALAATAARAAEAATEALASVMREEATRCAG